MGFGFKDPSGRQLSMAELKQVLASQQGGGQMGLPQASMRNSVIFKKPQMAHQMPGMFGAMPPVANPGLAGMATPMQGQLSGNAGQVPDMARPPFVQQQQPQAPMVPSLIDMAKQMPATPMMDQVDNMAQRDLAAATEPKPDDNSGLIGMLMGGAALAGLLGGGKGGGKGDPVPQAPAVMPSGNPRLQPVNFGRQTGLMQRSRPFAGYFGG